jgi:hypothetical protein
VSLDQFRDEILRLAPQSLAGKLELIEILYDIFVRENITGPSVYSLFVDEEKRPLQKGEPLPEKPVDPLSSKNKDLHERLLEHYEKDSETIYQNTQFLTLFFAIEILLESVLHADHQENVEWYLWSARFHMLYDRQMTSNVAHLQDKSIECYERYLEYKTSQTDQNDLA